LNKNQKLLWIIGVLTTIVLGSFISQKSVGFSPISSVTSTLIGRGHPSDIAQNFYGFFAIIHQLNPYAELGPALKLIGVDWDVHHASTHPPTAFLLASPAALFPWPISAAIWAYLMIALLFLSIKIYCHQTSKITLALCGVLLFWPPIAFSLGQITILWLFFCVLAYKYRNTNPFLAGIYIGTASLTKFLPCVMLAPFILRKKWHAVFGFILVWVVAGLILLVLAPNVWFDYLNANHLNFQEQMMRTDGSSFLVFLYKKFGLLGFAMSAMLLFALIKITLCQSINNRLKPISEMEWEKYMLISILILPIAWIYSIAPLTVLLLKKIKFAPRYIQVLAVFCFFIVTIFPPFGNRSPLGIFLFFVGFCFLVLSSGDTILKIPNKNIHISR